MEKVKQKANPDDIPAVSCKRKDMLNLTLENYKKYRDLAIKGFIKAAKLLMDIMYINPMTYLI
jgi:hypothetical protein